MFRRCLLLHHQGDGKAERLNGFGEASTTETSINVYQTTRRNNSENNQF
jgi:hypothetical protein